MGARYHRELKRHFDRTIPDPDFGLIHSAGTRGIAQDVPFRINNEGFRGPDIPLEKSSGEKRLLILGDSIVFGWGVREERIFPTLLQNKFQDAAPEWRVAPIGTIGWNTRNQYEYMRKRGFDLQPDAVLLVMLPNDVYPNWWGRSDEPKHLLFPGLFDPKPTPTRRQKMKAALNRWREAVIRNSFLLVSVQHHIAGMRASGVIQNAFVEENHNWLDMRAALLGLIADCKARGIKILVAYHELEDTSSDSFFKTAVNSILDEAGIPRTATPAELFRLRYYVSVIDNHPNAKCHEKMAELYWNFLNANGVPPARTDPSVPDPSPIKK
jgi:hypothetical protein